MKRIVDTYIDVDLPHSDAKIAGALCVGGATKHELRPGTTLNDYWVMENVGSSYSTIFPSAVTIAFGKVWLWIIFNNLLNKMFDENTVARVKADVGRSSSNDLMAAGVNP